MRKRGLILIIIGMLCVPGLARAMSCGADSVQELALAAWSDGQFPGLGAQDEITPSRIRPLPPLVAFAGPFGTVPLHLMMGEPHSLDASLDDMGAVAPEADISQLFMRNTGNPALALQSMKSGTARELRILLSALDRVS